MTRKKPSTGEIYHLYNRGVEKRNIFLTDSDYFRFIHDLFEFNDREAVLNLTYHIKNAREVGTMPLTPRKIERQPRKLLVELMSFCLMPNHFHLLVRQKVDNGISLFMQKLGTGYTVYFNKIYKRVGSLFQGTYKTKLVKDESHLLHLPYYIHTNPLDLVMPEWREKEIKDYKRAFRFLESYRWSSFPDYIGKRNFPSVTQRNFLLQMSGNEENYKREFAAWLKNMNLESLEPFTLEPIIEVKPQ
ncbi:MAG: transposase [Patescibacteria group bacterium]|nr:transposase [Patescibacteria group bacterium]